LRRENLDVPDEKAEDVLYLLEQLLTRRQFSWRSMGIRRAMARLSRLSTTTSFSTEYRDTSDLTLEMIRQIQAPVLLIYGDRSPLTASLQFLCNNLPNRRAEIIPNGGHYFPLEHPTMFVEYVSGFLQGERSP